MPIYEYRCKDCEKVFEYMQRMSDPAKSTCEACSGTLERLISQSAFHLKGGGWYKDLYSSTKKDSGSSAGGSSSSSEGSGGAKEGSSSDSAKKTESKATKSGGD